MSEQFEHNIRKLLQDAEAPFEPMAWERMEKLLDDPRRRRPIWWWLGGLVLILSLGGWWFFSRPDVDNPASKSHSIKKQTSSQNTDGSFDENETKTRTGNNEEKPNLQQSLRAGQNPQKIFVERKNVDKHHQINPASQTFTTKPNDVHENVDNRDDVSIKIMKGNVNLLPGNPNVDKLDKDSITVVAAGEHQKTESNDVEAPPSVSIDDRKKEDKSVTANPNVSDSVTTPQSNLKTSSSDPRQSYPKDSGQKKPPGPRSAPGKRGFEGGIFFGPDVNTTGSFSGMHAGFTGGLLFRYHIINKWFVSSGAAYTKKWYGASPKEYNSPYPGNYVNIDADCDVIDVPLNVHFVFADRPAGRWNVSAGASTYFMLREKYDYYYPNSYKRTRVFSNQNQHWFSVINLSAGWEKRTKGRLNWGLQPFVKIPAGGVGEGKVKLYSAGMSLQVTMGKK